MKKETLLLNLVVLLVLLNATILYFLFNQNKPPRLLPHDHVIIETLSFDERQVAQFQDMKRAHRMQLNAIDDTFRRTLESYFLLTATQPDAATKARLEGELMELERQKVAITFEHFAEMRNLCDEDQKAAFDAFVPQLVQFILPPAPHRRPPFSK